ncbi:hypothetical protein PHYPSEUDO_007424 [Phytophthora pseudosyringae]|uniref:Uncharacterized protein n=1 Tax=Phytophthora pseudosyringae TaxID=221518 RepID=A0A8T1WI80_9STRA|nr:hypothetical protein PHYPSEUDO_007424 [Phytophthora pseudosyringae]
MLVRPQGWGDTDVLALLTLFRKHLLSYVYASDNQFAEVVRAQLPDKDEAEILLMARALMEEFGLRFSTKNFRTDVIVTNGQEVYVYEHIYESIQQLPENRAGGVWLPDELSRFLEKARQYRDRFTDTQETYFKQVQLWGKSIAETKSKFYALREIFLREKRRPRQRTGVGTKRLEILKGIFTDVPPARRVEKVAAVPSKAPKMWSSQEMETLVDFLVRITIQIQRTGSSDLVDRVAETLHDYAAFVQDIAEQCQWVEKVVHNVLRGMQHSIDLYRSNKLVDFFYTISSLTPGVTFQDLFADAQHILTQFEKRFGTLDGFENLVLTVPDISSPKASLGQETNKDNRARDSQADAVSTIANAQGGMAKTGLNDSCNSEEAIFSEDECDHDQSPSLGSPTYEISQRKKEGAGVHMGEREHEYEQSPLLESPQTGNESAAMEGDEHEDEQSPLLDSPTQTPQTGNEDAADEHRSGAAEKQSSPEDTWDDGGYADADLEEDGLDNHSVGSSDNAWSGWSNFSDTKNTHRHSKGNSPLNNPYPLSRQFASADSKKPSKRGKDEQYGKNFDLAKKRRLDEQASTAIRDDKDDEVDEDDEDREDDGYDEGEESGSLSSEGELEETPHPLQSMLDSLDSQVAALQAKQRKQIEREEDRWRQREYAAREYGF